MDEENPVDKPDPISTDSTPEDQTQKQLQEILERVGYMERVLRDQLSRLYEIEMRMGITPTAFRPQPMRPPQPFARPAASPPTEPRAAQPPPVSSRPTSPYEPLSSPSPTLPGMPRQTAEQEARLAQPNQAQPTAERAPSFGGSKTGETPRFRPPNFPPPAPPKKKDDLEFRIGGTWFNLIGVVVIVFAVGFFLKYAFESGWITPPFRVLTGIVVGLGFLAAGEWLRTKYTAYAYRLTGGGILILYLSAWASFRLYSLAPQKTVFIFMALITAAAVILAARYNAIVIAILGLFGGFLTPILLSTGVDNQTGLFGYIALLNAGVLALAFTKQWRSLNYLCFSATVLMVLAWIYNWWHSSKLWTTIFFLTLFFIIFALIAVLYNVINKRPTTWLDLTLVFLNATLYFGASYSLLSDSKNSANYHAYLGGFAVLMACFYGVLGWFTYSRDREDRLLILTFYGLAFLFLFLAVPIQFNQQWVTMAWAIEGAVMTYIGLRVKDKTSLYAALAVFGIAAFHWFTIDAPQFGYQAGTNFTPIWNNRGLSCAVLVAALASAALMYKRLGAHLRDEERSMFNGMYLLGANVFAITLLSLDINQYFEQRKATGDLMAIDAAQKLSNQQMFAITALWAMYGAAALFIGVTRRLSVLRFAALLLLIITTVKIFVFDFSFYAVDWHDTIFNQTFAAFASIIAALGCGIWLYSRAEELDEKERNVVLPVLIGAANVLLVFALSAEVVGHFQRELHESQAQGFAQIEERKQFVLSTLWTLYGAAALGVGIWRGAKLLWAGGLLLLTITILKLMVVDLSNYNANWHTLIFNFTFGAFAWMIAALGFAAWYYDRSEAIEGEERFGIIPVLIVAANALALVALSAEAWGYFEKYIIVSVADSDFTKLRDLRLAQQLSLSVIWAIYGGVMLTIGILRRSRLLRIMALMLLSLAILKVFIFDLAGLEKLYRIMSFLVLGMILMAVSLLYQRFRFLFVDKKEEEEEAPPLLSDSQ